MTAADGPGKPGAEGNRKRAAASGWSRRRGETGALADAAADEAGDVLPKGAFDEGGPGVLSVGVAQLKAQVEAADAAAAMFDAQMRYLALSRRWREDYDLGAADIVGRSHYEVFPEIPYRWRLAHRAGIAGQWLFANHDQFVRSDSRVVSVGWQIRPWRSSKARVGGIVLITELLP